MPKCKNTSANDPWTLTICNSRYFTIYHEERRRVSKRTLMPSHTECTTERLPTAASAVKSKNAAVRFYFCRANWIYLCHWYVRVFPTSNAEEEERRNIHSSVLCNECHWMHQSLSMRGTIIANQSRKVDTIISMLTLYQSSNRYSDIHVIVIWSKVLVTILGLRSCSLIICVQQNEI
jgi:hypothetical protein